MPRQGRFEEPEGERRRNEGSGGPPAERPGYGRGQWGVEEQGGWRGPGESPGSRSWGGRAVAFQQGSAGGQIPAEYRQWSPETPRRRHRPGSDERIREELCDRLMADPHVDASEIEVEVQQGRILLRGTVPDRRAKHRAEDLADAILGSTEIDNQLRVRH